MEREQAQRRLRSVERAREYMAVMPAGGDEEGEQAVMRLLDAVAREAEGGPGAVSSEQAAQALALLVADGGGVSSPLGQKVYGMIAYLGSPLGESGEEAQAYYFFRDLLESVCGVGGKNKTYSDFGKSLSQIRKEAVANENETEAPPEGKPSFLTTD